jgi:ribosome maturation factor RimP
MDATLERSFEERLASLGFELVELERAGSKNRPILRLRIDRYDDEAGAGVNIDDCARVSRALERWLDEEVGERYVLEVSSPGLDRPLVRRRDFERFAGKEIALRGHGPLAGRGRRLEGELLGVVDAGDGERVRLRLGDGTAVDIPRADIARAHLIFRWPDEA